MISREASAEQRLSAVIEERRRPQRDSGDRMTQKTLSELEQVPAHSVVCAGIQVISNNRGIMAGLTPPKKSLESQGSENNKRCCGSFKLGGHFEFRRHGLGPAFLSFFPLLFSFLSFFRKKNGKSYGADRIIRLRLVFLATS